MSGEKTATIFITEDPAWLELVSTYDQDFVADLKLYIQPQNRLWNAGTRSWKIRIDQKNRLLTVLSMNDYVVSEEDLSLDKSNIFTRLFEVVPVEYTTKVYYALAQALHPDKGGSEEQMKQLNAAYGKVKRGN